MEKTKEKQIVDAENEGNKGNRTKRKGRKTDGGRKIRKTKTEKRKGKENRTWGRARSGGAAASSTPVRWLQGLSVLGVAAARLAWALSLSA